MGTWGTGLYADDTTCEVRDEFRSHLASGLPPGEAEAKVLARYEPLLHDPQVACLVFFALADVQWRSGCLSDAVKQNALDLLDRGGDLEHWAKEAPRDAAARRRTLAALRERLLSPPPPWKPPAVKKRASRAQLDLPVGSVLRLNLPQKGFALLKLVGFLPVGPVATALFRVLPWHAGHMPGAAELQALSEQWVALDGHREFSILFDGRRKLTALLDPTGIVLQNDTPIDRARWRAYGPEALVDMTASALAAFGRAP